MRQKYNLLFFHPQGLFYGGTEKLLQIFAKYLSSEFNVFYAYAPQCGEERKEYFSGTAVKLVPFSFKSQRAYEPFDYAGLTPKVEDLINKYHIDCICLPVYSKYQFPLNTISAAMPFVLTSPFGHFATNGSVQRVFVSGKSNLERMQRTGVKIAELIYDPIEDFEPGYLNKGPVNDVVVFGRVGRADNNIFDPISLKAYAKLEKKYGNKVKYEWLTPPPAAEQLAKELGLNNFTVDPGTQQDYLPKFYQRVDILAHARKDGETFGKAIAEAMLAGLPIVTHRSHGYNEHLYLLDQSYARYSEPDDVEKYFENMEGFVLNKEKIRPMGQLARKRALELCSPKAQMPHLQEVFYEAAEKCTYYSRPSFYRGKIVMWWNNFKQFPYFAAKRTLYNFPFLSKKALAFYQKINP